MLREIWKIAFFVFHYCFGKNRIMFRLFSLALVYAHLIPFNRHLHPFQRYTYCARSVTPIIPYNFG